ncbi:MAG: hypothetical protein NC132_01995 [Corallococcus sp.]|nr:hypothetical protein [Corallococcus sp.]MCM1359319.1 hypothetical protein [Corallococcus sp.]MCM1394870.1 hypothetical protein [Corallococcus sp.]
MTDSERMKYAHIYVSKLSKGINPLDDSIIVCNEVINNKHIANCLSYVANVLEKVCKGDYFLKRSLRETSPHDVAYLLKNFKFCSAGLLINETCARINSAKNEGAVRVSNVAVKRWLQQNGLTEYIDAEDGQRRIYPTVKGEKFGLFAETREGHNGKYTAVLLNEKAQREVIKNVQVILQEHLDGMQRRHAMKSRPWDYEQDEKVKRMFDQGMTVQEIAAVMARTNGAIRSRLVKLGAMH